ncbi:MAG: helix-turn-helix transcriptional regulator [Sphingomonas sp.]
MRRRRGESLAEFAALIGCSSKGRVSEIERGLAQPTVAQALRLEELSSGQIDASLLNVDVAASRRVLGVIDHIDHCTHGSASAIDDDLPEPERIIVCDVCERRVDGVIPNACTFVDCPYAQRIAA